MASRRKGWDSLSPSYRARLSRNGITKSQYERGRPLRGARGHGHTPEHGLKSVGKQAKRYGEYIRKRSVPEIPKSQVPANVEDEAYALNSARDAAYLNFHAQLKDYYKYKRETVLANVYGGTTSESGDVPGMTLAEARWTAQADAEEIRSHAEPQYTGNPWWYH